MALARAEIVAGAAASVRVEVPPHAGLAVVEGVRDQCVRWGVLVVPALLPPSDESTILDLIVHNAGTGHTVVFEEGDIVGQVTLVHF